MTTTATSVAREMGPETARKAAIAQTAAATFLRYGFRKASVDDIARAAKLSRQGVYLYFPNKEALFRAAVEFLAERTLEAERTALRRANLPLEDRLLGAFEAMSMTASYDPSNVQELFASAAELAAGIVKELDRKIVSELEDALAKERPSRLRATDVATRALAEHLYVTSYGLQHRGHSGDDYLALMRIGIRIVCKSIER
jgi:AcrR family transcriptional regulator